MSLVSLGFSANPDMRRELSFIIDAGFASVETGRDPRRLFC
jgi:hypothetical protein